jgi:hypothetical protein
LNDVRQAVTNVAADVVAISMAEVAESSVGNNPEVGRIIAEAARRIWAIERGTYVAEVKGIMDDDASMVSWQDPWEPVATARC